MNGRRHHLEQEIKLDVGPGFTLPDLAGERLPQREFTSTYHDTSDHRLLQLGITLRCRTEADRSLWQLKLPREPARIELEIEQVALSPPPDFLDLLVGVLRGRSLTAVAELQTARNGIRVKIEGTVADVVRDVVSVARDGLADGRLDEVEIEVVEGSTKDLASVIRELRRAGAADSSAQPKLARALGLAVVRPAPEPGAPPLAHVGTALAEHYRALVSHDPGVRVGDDPEDLHQLRVATRRLRAVLRAARPFLEQAWAEELRSELAWLGGKAGAPRDLDVLLDHLREESELLEPQERDAFAWYLSRLEEERVTAGAELLEAMRSDRYLALLDALETAAEAPHQAADPPASSVADLAAAEFRKLRRDMGALGSEPPDDRLHAVRIRGKRARYAAELAAYAIGPPALRFVSRAKAFQDTIGAHQDAVVAEQQLRRLVSLSGSASAALAAGRLIERQRDRKQRARKDLPAVWERLEQAGRKAWS
jgi:CHAD domain-containing protein